MMAIEVLKISNEKNQLIAQDLIIRELEIFFKHTLLELAIMAKAYDFVCLAPVQQLLTDVWFDQINSQISNWQLVFPYVFAPALLTNAGEIFRSDINVLINQTELSEKEPEIANLKKKWAVFCIAFTVGTIRTIGTNFNIDGISIYIQININYIIY